MQKKILLAGAITLLVLAVWWFASENEELSPAETASSVGAKAPIASNRKSHVRIDAIETIASTGDAGSAASSADEEPQESPEDAAVEAFDRITDRWMEPAGKELTMSDIDAFAAQFERVPDARKAECLQRALNLVPDENVMLLSAILMDKSQPKELLDLVFNDILNREEYVKNTILLQIFKDKSHPCWAETAWILDATGETPEKTGPVAEKEEPLS